MWHRYENSPNTFDCEANMIANHCEKSWWDIKVNGRVLCKSRSQYCAMKRRYKCFDRVCKCQSLLAYWFPNCNAVLWAYVLPRIVRLTSSRHRSRQFVWPNLTLHVNCWLSVSPKPHPNDHVRSTGHECQQKNVSSFGQLSNWIMFIWGFPTNLVVYRVTNLN